MEPLMKARGPFGNRPSAVIPEGAEEINPGELRPGIRRIYLPKSLVRAEGLGSLANLEHIEVSAGNPFFASRKGVLYSRDLRLLIKYPPARKARRFVMEPETEVLAKEAFENAARLGEIVFSSRAQSLGPGALRNTSAVFRIPEDNPFLCQKESGIYSKDGRVLFFLRAGGEPLLLEGITAIAGEIESSPSAAPEEVFLPDTLKGISSFPFARCFGLKTVSLPEGFPPALLPRLYSPSLRAVNAPPGAPFTVWDNGVYSADRKRLYFLFADAGRDIAVPDGTEEIGDFAFQAGSFLRISLPPSVKRLGRRLFIAHHKPLCRTEELALSSAPETAEDTFLDSEPAIITRDPGALLLAERFHLQAAADSRVNDKITSEDGRVTGASGNILGLDQIPPDAAEIEAGAFACSLTLEKALLPDNIRRTGDLAFADCHSLREVFISAYAGEIGDNPFAGLNMVREIRTDPHNPYYASEDGCLYNKDRTVLIARPCLAEDTVFRVPPGVNTISRFALECCPLMEEIYIPSSVRNIEPPVFSRCGRLKKIHAEGSYYTVENGMLVMPRAKRKKVVIAMPPALEQDRAELPRRTWAVAPGAFAFSRIKEALLPGTVRLIDFNAFAGSELEKINIPAGCVLMPEAFRGCGKLKEVRFGGFAPVNPVAFVGCSGLSASSRLRIAYMAALTRIAGRFKKRGPFAKGG